MQEQNTPMSCRDLTSALSELRSWERELLTINPHMHSLMEAEEKGERISLTEQVALDNYREVRSQIEEIEKQLESQKTPERINFGQFILAMRNAIEHHEAGEIVDFRAINDFPGVSDLSVSYGPDYCGIQGFLNNHKIAIKHNLNDYTIGKESWRTYIDGAEFHVEVQSNSTKLEKFPFTNEQIKPNSLVLAAAGEIIIDKEEKYSAFEASNNDDFQAQVMKLIHEPWTMEEFDKYNDGQYGLEEVVEEEIEHESEPEVGDF